MDILSHDLDDLKYAKSLLENSGFAAKNTNALGAPIEQGFDLLPKGWSKVVSSSTQKALLAAVNSAILTMNKKKKGDSANTLHKFLVAGSGAAGGFFGLPALPVELSVSTAIMMRSIADIARSEEQPISDPQVKVACIEVFALGGPGKDDDAVETGYFAIRSGLAKTVTDEEFDLLYQACCLHTKAATHDNITVQTCFDADRLDLGRVGTVPNAKYLCTDSAKSQEMIAWAHQRSIAGDVPDNVLGMFVLQE